jgi:hypothetical protein
MVRTSGKFPGCVVLDTKYARTLYADVYSTFSTGLNATMSEMTMSEKI